jgi:hypothetical protein
VLFVTVKWKYIFPPVVKVGQAKLPVYAAEDIIPIPVFSLKLTFPLLIVVLVPLVLFKL